MLIVDYQLLPKYTMNRLLVIFLLGFSCCWNDIHGILVCLDSANQTLQNTNGHSSLFFTIHLDFTIWISLKPMNGIDHLVCRSVPRPGNAEGLESSMFQFNAMDLKKIEVKKIHRRVWQFRVSSLWESFRLAPRSSYPPRHLILISHWKCRTTYIYLYLYTLSV